MTDAEQVEQWTRRWNALTIRFDAMTKRIDGMTERLDGTWKRLDVHADRMTEIEQRIDALVSLIQSEMAETHG